MGRSVDQGGRGDGGRDLASAPVPPPESLGWGSSDVNGSASAPYNMALARVAQKVNPEGRGGPPQVPVDLKCDKLRLGGWAQVPVSQVDELQNCFLGGFQWQHVGRGRNRGPRKVTELTAGLFAPRGEEGAGWLRCQWVEGAPAAYLVVEYNPQKVDPIRQRYLGTALAAMDLDPKGLFVDRFDAAMDYPLPRGYLLLDDPHRNPDLFEVGSEGPQTERTGYRRNSRLKFQLYDKSAERKAAGAEAPDCLTRFEVQVRKPDPLEGSGGLFGGGPGVWPARRPVARRGRARGRAPCMAQGVRHPDARRAPMGSMARRQGHGAGDRVRPLHHRRRADVESHPLRPVRWVQSSEALG